MKHSLSFGVLALPLLVACGGSIETNGTTGTTGAGGATSSTSATTSTSSATTSSATVGASSSASSSTGGIACPPDCGPGFTCCGGVCVNMGNDIHNCGACAKECLGDNPYCGNGNCQDPPCSGVTVCKGAEFCCGTECCGDGLLCCEVPGPGPTSGPKCTAPENGTCPQGCPACK